MPQALPQTGKFCTAFYGIHRRNKTDAFSAVFRWQRYAAVNAFAAEGNPRAADNYRMPGLKPFCNDPSVRMAR